MTVTNPALLGYLAGFVNAAGAALIAFNVILTQTQLAAVGGVVNAGFLLLLALLALRKSTSSSSSSSTTSTPPTTKAG